MLKRGLDLALAIACLPLFLPLCLIVGILIKLSSKGPVFFIQKRVGLNSNEFGLIKFRTMCVAENEEFHSTTTQRNDPRIFKGGQFLRKYKLDELPQIINVIIGTMSFVGPRPTVLTDHMRMTSRQQTRVSVQPGLTGLAQINGGTQLTWPERIELDLEYIDSRSFMGDLVIILKTVMLVFFGRADTDPISEDEWG